MNVQIFSAVPASLEVPDNVRGVELVALARGPPWAKYPRGRDLPVLGIEGKVVRGFPIHLPLPAIPVAAILAEAGANDLGAANWTNFPLLRVLSIGIRLTP